MMNYLFNDFSFDKRSKFSVVDQLYYHTLDKIFSYQVIPGQPFPAAEALAKQLSLTPSVVQDYYQRLLDERYVVTKDDSIMIYVSTHPDYMKISNVLDFETFFEFHGLQGLEKIIKDVKPAVIKQFQQWMLITKPSETPRNLHRLHHTKYLNIFYSVISMNPDYLPVQCDRCDDLTFLMDYWKRNHHTSFTTMVLFALNLTPYLAEQFGVLEGTSTFAFRSSLLDQNGHMMATFMYVVSPRVFFNTKFNLPLA
jgi:DNA-binding transcriptional regulator YhcF (GntR family)